MQTLTRRGLLRRSAAMTAGAIAWRPNPLQMFGVAFNYTAATAMFQHAYNICRVKDSEVGEQGKVFRADLERTFDILNAGHYKGYCSMEWEGPEDPYEGTKKLIARSLEYLA